MAKPSVLVLYNQPVLPGDHPDAVSEHSVIETADEVVRILSGAGFRVSRLALGADPSVLLRALKRRKPDVVFNLYEGQLDNPESESFVAGLLEWSGIPYTGSPPQTLSLARAKDTVKHLLRGAGLATADFMVVERLPTPACPLKFPVIVKPARQDASVGVDQASVCVNRRQLDQRVRYIHATYGAPVLIEEYIPGREINIALIELPELQTLAPAEIVFPAEKPGTWSIYTYSAKWTPGAASFDQTPMRIPTDITTATLRTLNQLAMSAYRLLGCRDYARVDFRVKPNGKPFILEINPNPDICPEADLTRCLASARLSHEEFVVRMVRHALSRRDAPKATFTPRRDPDRA